MRKKEVGEVGQRWVRLKLEGAMMAQHGKDGGQGTCTHIGAVGRSGFRSKFEMSVRLRGRKEKAGSTNGCKLECAYRKALQRSSVTWFCVHHRQAGQGSRIWTNYCK